MIHLQMLEIVGVIKVSTDDLEFYFMQLSEFNKKHILIPLQLQHLLAFLKLKHGVWFLR